MQIQKENLNQYQNKNREDPIEYKKKFTGYVNANPTTKLQPKFIKIDIKENKSLKIKTSKSKF